MDCRALDLEDLLEEHSVSSYAVARSLSIQYAVFRQYGIHGAPPTGAQEPGTYAPSHTRSHNQVALRECSLQVINLAQGWSDTVRAHVSLTALLAMVASLYIYVQVHFTPDQEYTHTSPHLLAAFAA